MMLEKEYLQGKRTMQEHPSSTEMARCNTVERTGVLDRKYVMSVPL